MGLSCVIEVGGVILGETVQGVGGEAKYGESDLRGGFGGWYIELCTVADSAWGSNAEVNV